MRGLGLRTLAVNAAATLGRQVGSGLLALATLAIIARVFGPEGNGAYTLALLLPTMLATLLNFGIGPANVYFLGANKVDPKQAWRTTLGISGWIVAIGWLIGGWVILFKAEQWFQGVATPMLWLSLAFFPIAFITGAMGNFFQGLQEFKQYNVVLLLQPVLNLTLVAVLVLFGSRDIFQIFICYFVSLVVTQAVAYKLFRQVMQQRTGPVMVGYGRKLLNYGYKAHLTNILAFVNSRADLLLLSYFSGPAAVGIYSVAVNITERLWLFSGAVSTVLLPRLSQLSSDEGKRNQLTPLIARWVFWITLSAGATLALVGIFAIRWIFGVQFASAYDAILWLLPGIVMGACSMILANDMAARGRPELNLATSWISVLINIVGNWILIPRHGVEGAAMATSFAYTINFMMRLAMHSRFTGVKFYHNFVFNRADFLLIKSVFGKKGD